jgi:mannose/fructose-specific phosphotransferase system component IIA
MKILVGYHGSNAAKEALELSREHAMGGESKIEVVNSMPQNRNLRYEDIRKVEENLEDEVHHILNSEKVSYQTYV